ncbi:DUF2971 domain-containing protein [Paraburkholderia ginsengisoli]|uniref:DUF2971 domain-containing protein n=1 Tax=Paraburkholderia ginsengisoli TaxID=311231 RepID=A0A7T4N0P6_9BURK|nr:DUF2971 domain-containing protein [Paraburkholderia ginsengisoli]QQC63117.1 DUF2971 domain-containing protein [Paraburkholderia ginsengisoli]
MDMKPPPRRLYKYRSFSTHTLRMVSEAEVFFAKPATFNDPFDCNPTVFVDVEWKEVERLWKSIALKQLGRERAVDAMSSYRYSATEDGGKYADGADGTRAYTQFLVRDIDAFLKQQFKDFGVFSAASRWDNPLMWSHYAEEHRGICVEYLTDDHRCQVLGPVDYNSSRYVNVSDLIEWLLRRSTSAKKKIFDQYFFAKAPQWKYEREWRAVSKTNGKQDRPFRIGSVHFGLRCDAAIVTTIVKLFAESREEPKFYKVTSRDDGFKLARYQIDPWEIEAFGLRESAHFAMDDFEFDPMTATGEISGRTLK